MAPTVIESTEIEMTDTTIELSETQVRHVNRGIEQGLADMKAGRCLSDPEAIEQAIQKRIDETLESCNSPRPMLKP